DMNAVSFYLLMSTSAHHRFKPTLFVGLNGIRTTSLKIISLLNRVLQGNIDYTLKSKWKWKWEL
ncbi:hypothetical protein JW960_02520, partial [candidate division KSB1 bacterium]|nr:hypothetical protein [candidate division KSB1 bacterium]